MNGKDFSWGSLNTLCWAVGSISGSMAEEQENRCAMWLVEIAARTARQFIANLLLGIRLAC